MSSSIPDTMAAVEIVQPGGPEVLRLGRRPLPPVGTGEVLIKVAAAGINRPDLMQRRGLYPPPVGASDIPGLEIAGTVVAVGEGVKTPIPGDAVCALVTGGGYAEFCTASADVCLPIPQGLSPIEAAALPETFFTVWANVFGPGQLRRGERFLVHGGSGGIGSTAIQLAREFGAEVYATAGTPEKCAFCERLGARAIDYRREDFAERIRDLTEGKGVDVILDMIGGPYLQRHLDGLAAGGRLLIIAVQGGPKAEINLVPIFLKRLTITGSTLRPRSVEEKAGIAGDLRAKIWPLLESGRIVPLVHNTFPLAAAAEAHRAMERGVHVGKLVLALG